MKNNELFNFFAASAIYNFYEISNKLIREGSSHEEIEKLFLFINSCILKIQTDDILAATLVEIFKLNNTDY